MRANDPLKSVDIKTMPHPGFPTDMQSQMMALMMTAATAQALLQKLYLKIVLCM